MSTIRAACALSILFAVACDDHEFNSGESTKVEGEGLEAVQSVMEGNCVACHNTASPQAGLDLSSEVFCDSVLDGRIVIAGNASGSVLVQRMQGDPSPMPPTGVMDDGNIQIVVDWIDGGADCDSSGGGSGDDGGSGGSGDDGTGDDGTTDTGDTGAPGIDGEAVYASSCSTCHGASGEGGYAPAMSTAAYGKTAEDIANIALNGSSGGGMAAVLTDEGEANAVGEYVFTNWGG